MNRLKWKQQKKYHSYVIDKITAEYRRKKSYERMLKRKEEYLKFLEGRKNEVV